MPTILSLCDHTGNWSRPYEEARYHVIRVDLQNDMAGDVRLIEYVDEPIHGILMAPPCDHFAASGARWWEDKGEAAILEGLAVVDACLRAVAIYRPVWWAMENPIGRLGRYLGPPAYSFNPCEFGELSSAEDKDAYTKRTCLWGNFIPPFPLFIGGDASVAPSLGSKMHAMPPSPDRKALRSATPDGFARAFFKANP